MPAFPVGITDKDGMSPWPARRDEKRPAIVASLARARLATIAGLFSSLRAGQGDIPSLSVIPTGKAGILTERVHELAEDAYLLEASAVRRFLGLGSNIAALRRD